VKSRNAITLLLALLTGACCLAPQSALATQSGGARAPSRSVRFASASTGTGTAPAASGVATWYGPGLFGRKTACGQTLTRVIVGVANRTLPCGTLVRVSYAGRNLVVPVIDRGPYSRVGAEWDLTAGAATSLGITETVRVSAHVVGSAPDTPTLGVPPDAPAPDGGVQPAAVAGGSLATA